MRIITLLPFVIAVSPLTVRAENRPAPVPVKSAPDTALAKLIAGYPLKTCAVSGEKLEDGGDMGDIVNYLHKEPGKPDRLVRFCCKGCIKEFKKDPAKYLKAIDEAADKRAKR